MKDYSKGIGDAAVDVFYNLSPEEFNKVCNILAEYAHQEKYSSAIRAYFDEHYDIILKKDALQILSRFPT